MEEIPGCGVCGGAGSVPVTRLVRKGIWRGIWRGWIACPRCEGSGLTEADDVRVQRRMERDLSKRVVQGGGGS